MKLFVIAFIGLSTAFASAKNLTCLRKPRQHDENNIASFELTANSKEVRLKATLTLAAIEILERKVPEYERSRDRNLRKYGAIYKNILGHKNDLQWAGTVLPYKKEPKTPRLRFPLNFAQRQFKKADPNFEFFAPEANRATLFVMLDDDGDPKYEDVSIEFNGGQGPYYEHFVCE